MYKIMIVDDNVANNDLHKDIIETWNYEVIQVYNGHDALVKANKIIPDLILLDVMLPSLNGFEVCKRIKSQKVSRGIRVIMLTILDSLEDRLLGQEAGADVFLTKPVNVAELKSVLQSQILKREYYYNIEERDDIIQVYLKILLEKNKLEYERILQNLKYLQKLGSMIDLENQQINDLMYAAGLESIVYIMDKQNIDDVWEVIKPLRLTSRVTEILQGMSLEQDNISVMGIEVCFFNIVRSFVEKSKNYENKFRLLISIRDQWSSNKHSRLIIQSFEQLLQDELIYEKYKTI